MNESIFKMYSNILSPKITKIIESNARFYRFKETIKWCFTVNYDLSIVAACGEDNVIYINILSVIQFYFNEDMQQIEYFLLHEIRHIFQNKMISDFKSGKKTTIQASLIETWIKEKETYQMAKDENGEENLKYFMQDIEIDAYAYAYAVMKYKNNDVSHLYVPNMYGADFEKIVDEWIYFFEANKYQELKQF